MRDTVEDILERTVYPSAPLLKCLRSPISEGEIAALMRNLEYEPTFRGVWTVAEDGTPVATLHALDQKNFRAAQRSMTGVLAWNWNHHFGRLVSFTLVIPGERSPESLSETTLPWFAWCLSVAALPSRSATAVKYLRSTWPTLRSTLNTRICSMLFALCFVLRIASISFSVTTSLPFGCSCTARR